MTFFSERTSQHGDMKFWFVTKEGVLSAEKWTQGSLSCVTITNYTVPSATVPKFSPCDAAGTVTTQWSA